MADTYLPPRPWRSVLLPHLDEIRQMRRARLTWSEIAERLTVTHGIKISPSNVYRFFKRAVGYKKLPLGFEDPSTECQSALPRSLPSANTSDPGQTKPVKPKPAWFPAERQTSQLTEEDLSFEIDPLKLRKPHK